MELKRVIAFILLGKVFDAFILVGAVTVILMLTNRKAGELMGFKRILAFLLRHKAKICFVFLGLVTAILMLTIGFFATLLIQLFVILGGAYGYLVDKLGFKRANNAIVAFLKQIRK